MSYPGFIELFNFRDVNQSCQFVDGAPNRSSLSSYSLGRSSSPKSDGPLWKCKLPRSVPSSRQGDT